MFNINSGAFQCVHFHIFVQGNKSQTGEDHVTTGNNSQQDEDHALRKNNSQSDEDPATRKTQHVDRAGTKARY